MRLLREKQGCTQPRPSTHSSYNMKPGQEAVSLVQLGDGEKTKGRCWPTGQGREWGPYQVRSQAPRSPASQCGTAASGPHRGAPTPPWKSAWPPPRRPPGFPMRRQQGQGANRWAGKQTNGPAGTFRPLMCDSVFCPVSRWHLFSSWLPSILPPPACSSPPSPGPHLWEDHRCWPHWCPALLTVPLATVFRPILTRKTKGRWVDGCCLSSKLSYDTPLPTNQLPLCPSGLTSQI